MSTLETYDEAGEGCRDGQVTNKINCLHKNIGQLRACQTDLIARLKPVLSLNDPVNIGDKSLMEPKEKLAPLAEQLRQACADLESLTFKLQDALNHLEL